MQTIDLAEKLVSIEDNSHRKSLLEKFQSKANVELAFALKEICYSAWTKEPTKAQKAALALENLAEINSEPKIKALSAWISGIARLTEGKIECALENLKTANKIFLSIKEELLAAKPSHEALYAGFVGAL